MATKDRTRTMGMGWTREEAAHQASECAVSPSLACVEMPVSTSSHPDVHTHGVCVHTCPVSIDLCTWTLHTFRN